MLLDLIELKSDKFKLYECSSGGENLKPINNCMLITPKTDSLKKNILLII